uniref:IS66 family insertion sequence element accessory protein TnpA n=1 Tax=Burkholderia arboris TaxID=488730 RepID=UPI003BEEE049
MNWDAHVEAADLAGVTLSSYAREHGLAVQALYQARRRMRDADVRQRTESSPEPASPFVEVKAGAASAVTAAAPATPRARVWAHLPNGVSVELLCTSADVELLVVMMDSLGRTGCSASTKI